MVKRKNQSGGEDEPVRKALRTLLPKPDAHSVNTQPALPFPAAHSRTRTQDMSSIKVTATLLAANGSHEEWFVGDGKVTAPRAEAKSDNTPPQQQSWDLRADGSSHPDTAFGTVTSTYQGLGFELDVSALRQAHDKYGSMPVGYIKASAIFKIGTYPMEVATCKAILIQRGSERHSFWHNMAKTGPRAFRLAFDLLDTHGFIQSKYHKDTYHRGSGRWGPELGYGHILLFEDITVSERLRGRGFGKKLVASVLEKVRTALASLSLRQAHHQQPASYAPFFAFVKPDASAGLIAVLNNPGTAPIPENKNDPALGRFWRSSGFTRVGSSPWFACSGSPSPIQQDMVNPPDWSPPQPQQHQTPRPELVDRCFSDHLAPSGPESRSPTGLDRLMILAYGGGPPLNTEWVLHGGTKDLSGDNVLHIAALTERPEMVHDIMSVMPELTEERNHQGFTPLEALQRQLHLVRTWPSMKPGVGLVPSRFLGLTPQAIQCIVRLSGPTPYRDLSRIHVLRLKYGCTCGLCDGGFLSPKMRAALKLHAKDFEIYTDNEWLEDYYGNLDEPIVRVLFVRVADVISTCLEDDDKIPDVATVQAEWARDGGERYGDTERHIRHVGARIIRNVSENTPSPEVAAGEGFGDCRNDYEFALISDVCGFSCDPV